MTPTLATAAAFDLAAIMREAHAIAARFAGNGWTAAQRLAHGLRTAWGKARMERRDAQARAAREAAEADRRAAWAALGAEGLRRAILAEEARPMLGHDGMATVAAMRAVLAEVEAADRAAAVATRRETVRKAILADGGRIVAVTFAKRDGTVRTMHVQPAAMASRVKGAAASPAGRQAAATRRHRHPELLPVWDVATGAIRSVNLDTVSRIAANGTVRTFDPAA